MIWSSDTADSVHSIDSSLTHTFHVNHGAFLKAFITGCSVHEFFLRQILTGVLSLFLAVVSSSRRPICRQRDNIAGPKDSTAVFSI